MKKEELQACLNEMLATEIPIEDIENTLFVLSDKYKDEKYAFQIENLGGGFQFLTKPAYQASISVLLKQKSRKRLSTSALEVLAIIAYKQPLSKSEIEQIRGVNCDYAVQKLLEKELIEIRGKSEAVGRPLLYGTSERFMEYFGINSIKDLPQPKDIESQANEIGENNG
ncbi:MAG: SMC-Scp complex subunit ScpB [Verrucomicrobia bacterium]|nr:SMC-Scp complex subunit ScpB [Cytophagales bacterium]